MREPQCEVTIPERLNVRDWCIGLGVLGVLAGAIMGMVTLFSWAVHTPEAMEVGRETAQDLLEWVSRDLDSRSAQSTDVFSLYTETHPHVLGYREPDGRVDHVIVAPRGCIEAMPLEWSDVYFDAKTPHIAHVTCVSGLSYVSETVPVLVP